MLPFAPVRYHLHAYIILAKLAYQILGAQHLGSRQPIVLVGGISSTRGDFERLSDELAKSRPVLIFDHRGIGDSTYSTEAKDDNITIESMARDLCFLVESLQWDSISICGYSMGGVITLQLLFLPHIGNNSKPLPFKITHVFLTATLTSVLKDKNYGVRLNPLPTDRELTPEVLREFIKPQMELMFDPKWLADASTQARQEWWLSRMLIKRPYKTIVKQARATNRFNFSGLHSKLRNTRILIVHGTADRVVPYYCGEEIHRLMPWAQTVQVGSQPGQLPSLEFGHNWYEYFDIKVWRDVFETFLRSSGDQKARL